jgi:hypothetical protein
MSDRQIHINSNDCVVTLKAELAGTFNGQLFSESYRMTRVWLQCHNRWQIIAGHVSQITSVSGTSVEAGS